MKKLTAVLLMLCMVATMGACSSSSSSGKKSNKDSKDDKKSAKTEDKEDKDKKDKKDKDDEDEGDILHPNPVLLQNDYYDADGNLLFTINYEYVLDRWGKFRMTDTVITGDASASLHTNYGRQHTVYDDDFLHSTYYYNDQLKEERFYDEDGNLIKELSYDNSQLNKTTVYEYDSEGKETKRSIYTPSIEEDDSYGVVVSTYNNDLLVHEELSKYDSGSVTGGQTFDYEYDGNGNLIKLTNHFIANDVTATTTYQYDDQNHCTLETVENKTGDGSYYSITYRYYEYVYNSDGTYEKHCFTSFTDADDLNKLKNGEYSATLSPTQILTYEGKRVLSYQYYNIPTDMSTTTFYIDEYSKATFGIPNT